VEAFREVTLAELAKLGFVEGRNLIVDARIGIADALPRLARSGRQAGHNTCCYQCLNPGGPGGHDELADRNVRR
jgi:hypothetical protein